MSALEKALKSRLVLVAGDEDVLRREALAGLLNGAQIEPDDFDLETYAGDASQAGDWLAAAGTSPFLAERRVVIVRHLFRFDLDRLKSADFSSLPASALLILVGDDEGGSDEKIQKMKSLRKAWEKIVNSAGGVVISCDGGPNLAKEHIRNRTAELGKTMSDKATVTLMEMTGGSVSRALDELEKLALFTSGQEQIREADVRSVVVPSREWNVYKMVDATIGGDVAEALRQLKILIGSANKAEDAAFSRILPTVSRQLRLLWQARLCVEAKCNPSNATKAVLACFPDKPNLTTEAPYRQSNLMQSARKTTMANLERCLGILADTDSRLKGVLPSPSGIESLERMVLEMAEAARA